MDKSGQVSLSLLDFPDGLLPCTSEQALLQELHGRFSLIPAIGFNRVDYLRAWRHVELVASIRFIHGWGISATQIIEDLTNPSELFLLSGNCYHAKSHWSRSVFYTHDEPDVPLLTGYSNDVIQLEHSLRAAPLVPNHLRRLMLLLRLPADQKHHLLNIVNAALRNHLTNEDYDAQLTIAQTYVP